MYSDLIGQWVKVTYKFGVDKTQEGRLENIDPSGEVEIRDRYGITHYLYPSNIEKCNRNASSSS